MSTLQQAQPEPSTERPQKTWGIRQSVVLAGTAVTLTALALAAFYLSTRPIPPGQESGPEQIRSFTRELKPLSTWQYWQGVRARGLDPRRPEKAKAYQEALLRWWVKIGVALLITLVGAATAVVPLLMKGTGPTLSLQHEAPPEPP